MIRKANKQMEQSDRPRLGPTLGRLLNQHRRHIGWLIGAMLAGVIGGGTQVGFSWALRGLLGGLVDENDSLFGTWLLAIAVLFLLAALTAAAGRYLSGRYGGLVMRSVRLRMSDRLIKMRLPEMERQKTGDLLSLMGHDANQLGQYLEEYLPGAAFHIAWFLLAFVSAFILSWELLLFSFAAVPLILLAVSLVGRPVQQLTKQQSDALGQANVVAQDAVSGQVEAKTFGLQDWLRKRHDQAVERWVDEGEKAIRARVRMDMTNFLNLLIPVLIMGGVGAHFVLQGRMTAADVLGFISVSNGLINPLMMLGQFFAETRKAAAASARLWGLLELPGERTDGDSLQVVEGDPLVELRQISFSYDRQDDGEANVRQQVFENFNLTIHPGESVAVVGGSGSGKSTLLKLLAGFYQPDAGEIRFGGHPQDKWSLAHMRRHMALVQQDTVLFPGTLEENIALGAIGDREDVPKQEIHYAADQAQIADWIVKLPEGWETLAGERGARLSGGQRQRISLARAALRKTDLLLLDEPTSALDTVTEKAVQHELEQLMQGRTSVVVAHRLSTIRRADRILVLEGGRICEEGSHHQLMERRGRYWELVQAQTEREVGA